MLDGMGIATGIDIDNWSTPAHSSPMCWAARRCRVPARHCWPGAERSRMSESVPQERPRDFRRVAQFLNEGGHPHVRAGSKRRHAPRRSRPGARRERGQIAKSVDLRRRADDVAVLVVTSGDKRVDEKKVAALVGALDRPMPSSSKPVPAFRSAGVSPLAHVQPAVTLIDASCFRFGRSGGGGSPEGVFCLSPEQLVALTGAPWPTWCRHDSACDQTRQRRRQA